MLKTLSAGLIVLFAVAAVSGCAPDPLDPRLGKLPGAIISSKTTMQTAWDLPNDPLNDPTLGNSDAADRIRWGFRLFTDTPDEAPEFSGGRMACNNCHLNAGQRELALPLVGVAAVFPEYNRRAGRDFTLEDRIVGCFYRSQNATGTLGLGSGPASSEAHARSLPSPTSPEVLALSAYLRWLSRGFEPGESAPWRRRNVIAETNRIPIEELDPSRGKAIFMENCTNCHGEDGQGVAIGDKQAGPLWGPDSWNDGAGAARVYTLAGIIRYMMPYLDPGKLTDEEAQHVAAFIDAQSRPVYPFKHEDYRTAPVPVDSVYYPER